MHHDHVLLSSEEKAAFAALVASASADARGDRRNGARHVLLAAVGIVAITVGGLMAATGTGWFVACGWLGWATGVLTTMWVLMTAEGTPGWGCPVPAGRVAR